jgi:hypothetical protein
VDFDAIIFNTISSKILKWLRFKVVSWRHDFQPCTAMVWDCVIVGLFWLHHIQCYYGKYCMEFTVGRKRRLGSDVTMATRVVVYCRAKGPEGIAGCLVPLNQI